MSLVEGLPQAAVIDATVHIVKMRLSVLEDIATSRSQGVCACGRATMVAPP
jgi:hypothetical protein